MSDLRSRVVQDDSRPSAWLVALTLLVLIPLVYCSIFLDQGTLSWLIEEEHPIELLGALSLLAGSVACIILWFDIRGDPAWPRLRRMSILGFALLFFFGAGEEESWGQRILGIKTPPSIENVNEQGETNLHNLTALHSINTDTLFSVLWLVIGVIVPVMALWPAPRRYLERFLPILPVALSGLFILNQILYWAFEAFFAHQPELDPSQYPIAYSLVEIKEKMAELLLATGFIFILLRRRSSRHQHT